MTTNGAMGVDGATVTFDARVSSPCRSWLFVPGSDPGKTAKALGVVSDVVIVDLEDSVAPEFKADARRTAVESLHVPRVGRLFVRINALQTRWCFDDLLAVVRPGIDGLVLPKIETGVELRIVDWVVSHLERDRGMPPGSVELLPLIETAAGIVWLQSVQSRPDRVSRLAFGGADYTADLGVTWTRDEDELAFARQWLVHASRAARLQPPVDTVSLEIRDLDGFRLRCERARQRGFGGKLCIHPGQVAVANAAFVPTPAELERARAVVAAYERAAAAGRGATRLDDELVDAPVVLHARRLLASEMPR
jgi:citrate lyase subunit beta / citryl-CoA lyase